MKYIRQQPPIAISGADSFSCSTSASACSAFVEETCDQLESHAGESSASALRPSSLPCDLRSHEDHDLILKGNVDQTEAVMGLRHLTRRRPLPALRLSRR